MPQQGFWYDGRIAHERPVEIVPEPRRLILIDSAGQRHPVDIADLVWLDSTPGRRRFGHRSLEGWRLILTEPVEAGLDGRLPNRIGSLVNGPGRRTMSIFVGLCAIACAFAGMVIFAPERIARQMPLSWERNLGSVYELPIAAARCEDPGALAALSNLLDRIDPQARPDGFTLELAQLHIANAAALPGGRMVLFTGLVEEAGDTEAVAGILALEIAHVRERHVAAALVRELGLGTVVTLFGGGAIAGNAGNILSLQFSRRAEAEADAAAILMLERAAIDPRPTARMFERLSKAEGAAPEFLSSHPVSSARAKRFADSYDPEATYRPALGGKDSRALLAACK